MLISVAIPCYKSAKTLPKVVDDTRRAILERPENDYQIILVNDYPYDETFEVITELCRQDNKIIGVNLSKNHGQTTALIAATHYFSGDVLVFADDDGQHPVDQIYKLVDKVSEGFDKVYAYFPHKKHRWYKRITSWLNSKISELNGTKPKGIHASSFMAMSKLAAESLKEYHSPFPSMGGFHNSILKSYANVELEHKNRLQGKSNYTLRKLLKLWFTGFTNFSLVPLRIASLTGTICALGGFIFGFYLIIRKLVQPNIAVGYTSILAVILFLGGLTMIFIGLIGEYVGRIYMTVSDMPQFTVREELNVHRESKHE